MLLEQPESGRDECFAEVAFERPAGESGALVRAHIAGVEGDRLIGTAA